MESAPEEAPKLLAISDLHVAYEDNKKFLGTLTPQTDGDWLIVAGDVGETTTDIHWALRTLAGRFARVIWTPGNHELWTPRDDPDQTRGEERYQRLVEFCRGIGVLTPEDPYPTWQGPGGPVTVAPLFALYDYTFRPQGTYTKQQALDAAYEAGVVCTDEMLLHPDPHPSRDAWCRSRVRATEERLAARPPGQRTVLVNHWPLVREPTRILRYPEFALWCGTELTAEWHIRFDAAAVVYGHLHIPRTTWHDGVPFEEVSVGYPREWSRSWHPTPRLRQILPEPVREPVA
ncbi:metallophosphoesterase family protein [Streptomyces boncukensis]|uniref:Metallophosphoesterase n=1 Tax=Streptomyces boncukensis TaxID=2711219 RepID=A0A6G4X7N1_9ACTN|nr:metallophosphoesterase [Streptomyces boncukensis]NGO73546.1 metallophosphoesterase [Streptomyces boncukensis]